MSRSPVHGLGKLLTQSQLRVAHRYLSDLRANGSPDFAACPIDRERVDGGRVGFDYHGRVEAKARVAAAEANLDRVSRHVVAQVLVAEIPLTEYAEQFSAFPQARERRAIALQRLRDALDQLAAAYGPERG